MTDSKALREALQAVAASPDPICSGDKEHGPYCDCVGEKVREALAAPAGPAAFVCESCKHGLHYGRHGAHSRGCGCWCNAQSDVPAGSGASEPPIMCCEPFDALGRNFCRLPAGHGGAHSPRQPQPLAAVPSDRTRCNYYFGGFDGGNRCQLNLEHGDGHQWRADREAAIRVEAERSGK